MKILATSDLHGYLPTIPECDVLLIGGDVCPVKESHNPPDQAIWLRDKFNPWLKGIPAEEIVWIAGNHDFALQAYPMGSTMHGHYLCDQTIMLKSGLKIHGTPWVPNLKAWAFYGDHDTLVEKFDKIPQGLDILLSHGPPYGIADHCPFPVGSKELLEALDSAHPTLTVCGHIHEGHGFYENKSSNVANVAYLNEYYKPVHDIVDISDLV